MTESENIKYSKAKNNYRILIFGLGILLSSFGLAASSLFLTITYKSNWTEYILESIEIGRTQTGKEFISLSKAIIPEVLFEYGSNVPMPLVFTGKDSKVNIAVGKSQVFPTPELKHPHTISFKLLPSSQKNHSVILSKTIHRSGLEYGIELVLKNKILQLELKRFFEDDSSKKISYTIIASHPLQPREWNHIAIEFRPIDPVVILYINGKESGRGPESKSIVSMGFHPDDSTAIVLGKDFFGKIDEFRILSSPPNLDMNLGLYEPAKYNLDSKNVNQKYGRATSPVYKTKFSHSYFHKIHWEKKSPLDTLTEVWARTSFLPFAKTESEDKPGMSWKPLDQIMKQPVCGASESRSEENCFSYYQFRFILRADPNGVKSPEIQDFVVDLKESKPPKKITGLGWNKKTSDLSSNKICLHWIASDESNVWMGGGYLIHYGFKEGEIVGTLRQNSPYKKVFLETERTNLKDIEGSEAKTKRVSLIQTCLDNTLISKYSEQFYPEKNLPFFKPGITVFFQVSAINKFWSETGPGKDQVSLPSRHIAVSLPLKDP